MLPPRVDGGAERRRLRLDACEAIHERASTRSAASAEKRRGAYKTEPAPGTAHIHLTLPRFKVYGTNGRVLFDRSWTATSW